MIEHRTEVTRVWLADIVNRAGEAVDYLCIPVDVAISMMNIKDGEPQP